MLPYRWGHIMKIRVLSFLAFAAALPTAPATAFQMGDATQTLCADGTNALCSTQPTDMNGHPPSIGYDPNTSEGGPQSFNQTFVDYFGWQAFVALNWPVDADGRPSTGRTIVTDTTSPRVWTTFKTKDDVFGTEKSALSGTDCATKKGSLKLFRTSKFGLSDFTEAFTPYPLIDRQGNFVLYDVRLNDTEVKYLLSNNLTTKAGQQAFGKAYEFPGGSGTQVGSIEIKSSWRIMTDKDDRSRYYTSPATIVVPAEYSETDQPMCIEAVVGLVGMHIMQKFSNPSLFSNFWSWSTFEHALNAPLADGAPVSPVNPRSTVTSLAPPACNRSPDPGDTTPYSFYNQACQSGTQNCPVNQPPKLQGSQTVYKWSASQPYASAYLTAGANGKYGTQVARCFALYPSALMVSKTFQAQLANSPWSNYMLVGAQWAANTTTGTGPFQKLSPFAAPLYLANTTSETYLQTGSLTDPNKGSGSCITCHNLGTDTANNPSNFSFLPGDAQ